MSTAIPVSTPDVVLLAAVATTLEIARTGDRRIEVHDHPLHQRAQRNHCGWVPLLLDELDACTQTVEELHEHGGVLQQPAESAVHQAWSLAAAEQPVASEPTRRCGVIGGAGFDNNITRAVLWLPHTATQPTCPTG